MASFKAGKIQRSKHFDDNYLNGINRALLSGLNQVGRLGAALARERAPEGATKAYKRGITYRVFDSRLSVVIFVEGAGAKYAEFVEFGRGPGKFPPPPEIEKWLVKSRQGRRVVTGVKRKFKIKKRETAVKSATYLVSRKIAQKGTKGKLVFTQVEDILDDAVPEIMRRRLEKVL